MKFKALLITLTTGLMILSPLSIHAATFQTKDHSLSIETPDDSWKKKESDKHNLVLTSSIGTITIDQITNGEKVPNIKLADEDTQGVIQSFLSTPNNVYIIKGKTEDPEDLGTIIKIMGTLTLTRYTNITAASPATAPATAQQSGQSQPAKGATATVSNQTNGLQDTFPVWFGDGTSAGTMFEYPNGKYYLNDNTSQPFDYNGSGVYYNSQYTVYSYNPAEGSGTEDIGDAEDTFPVWYEDGISAGTMFEYPNGKYYLNDNTSQPFSYNGEGVYSSSQYTVYAYNPGQDSTDSLDDVYLMDSFPVWDENGNDAGFLYEYSNGSFYLNDSHAEQDTVSYVGNGIYQNVQMTLYAYNPGTTGSVDVDEDDYEDDYNYDDEDYDYEYNYN